MWRVLSRANASSQTIRRLFSDGATPAPAIDTSRKLRLIYGSQTGTATMLTQLLAKAAKKKKWQPEVVNAAKVPQLEASKVPHIFVVSCFGQGEPTDSARALHGWLGKEEAAHATPLPGLPYAVFGLGSSEYAGHRYQRVGIEFDTRLKALGGTQLIPRGVGDASTDIEGHFEVWQDKLLKHLDTLQPAPAPVEAPKTNYDEEKIHWYTDPSDPPPPAGYYKEVTRIPGRHNFNHPLFAPAAVHRQLHGPTSPRSAHHIEFDLPQGMTYAAGDYLAVFPENPPHLVEAIARRVGVRPSDQFSLRGSEIALMLEKVPPWFPNPCTAGEALGRFCDLQAPPQRHFLRFLAERAGPADRDRLNYLASLSSERREELQAATHYKPLDQLLDDYPSVKLTFQDVLEQTPPLKFRYYSISSSPSLTPSRVSITVVRNAYSRPRSPGAPLLFGAASGFLDRITVGTKVPIFVQESPFRLPPPSVPIVMVGAGTGLAPFRGFLQERKAQGAKDNMLFFGCMRRDQDFIYREELEQWAREGLVDLTTAFSHEQPQLIFVQYRLRERGRDVVAMLDKGAHFYVCGSLAMGAGVEEVLKEAVAEVKGPDAAASYLRALSDQERLHWDLFA